MFIMCVLCRFRDLVIVVSMLLAPHVFPMMSSGLPDGHAVSQQAL